MRFHYCIYPNDETILNAPQQVDMLMHEEF